MVIVAIVVILVTVVNPTLSAQPWVRLGARLLWLLADASALRIQNRGDDSMTRYRCPFSN